MAALDPRDVEEARSAADQRAAGEDQLGQRLEAAIADRPRAIGNAPSALEDRGDRRMGLPLLERFERREVRVGVTQPDDIAERDLIAALVVKEPAAKAVLVLHRPALGVDHPALGVVLGIDVPQFFQPDPVDLRLGNWLRGRTWP